MDAVLGEQTAPPAPHLAKEAGVVSKSDSCCSGSPGLIRGGY